MPHGIMGNVAKRHGSKKKKKKKLWDGYPPLWTDRLMDGQTRVKTLPSRRTTYAGGNNILGSRVMSFILIASMACYYSTFQVKYGI